MKEKYNFDADDKISDKQKQKVIDKIKSAENTEGFALSVLTSLPLKIKILLGIVVYCTLTGIVFNGYQLVKLIALLF